MEAFTPLLSTNSVFQMYTSLQDKASTDELLLDTVMCSTEFWGLNVGITVNEFKVEDYVSNISFLVADELGTNESALEPYLDTSNGGTSDWWLSPFADDNGVDCNDSYCKVSCVVYRELVNDDKENDIQFAEKDNYAAVGGFRVWDTRRTLSNELGF